MTVVGGISSEARPVALMCTKTVPLESMEDADDVINRSRKFVPVHIRENKVTRNESQNNSPYGHPLALVRASPPRKNCALMRLPNLQPRDGYRGIRESNFVLHQCNCNFWFVEVAFACF